jgi:hypothetical protein
VLLGCRLLQVQHQLGGWDSLALHLVNSMLGQELLLLLQHCGPRCGMLLLLLLQQELLLLWHVVVRLLLLVQLLLLQGLQVCHLLPL